MRAHSILLVAVGLTLAACDETDGPSTDGTLVVSTSTAGNDPDPDGYLLTVDNIKSLVLDLTGTVEVDLAPGRHTLQLSGVADHCSVAPATLLDLDIPPRGTTPVSFEISCPATGAAVTTTTTGIDIDPDGYRVAVDGTNRGAIPPNATVLTRLDPGSRTITLTGLTPNCTLDGPASRTVTIVISKVEPIDFVVVCTATSGVIGVVVEASGTDVDGVYEAMVDGARSVFVGPSEPAYLTAVPAGDHVVSLVAPTNCSVEGDPQSVAVTVGGLIRDTAEVAFSVTCVPRVPGRLRITAPTTGSIPTARYSVWICRVPAYGCLFYGTWRFLGELEPNGTLVANPEPGRYQLNLRDIPARCGPPGRLSPEFTITANATIDIEFRVRCSP
jgi:hypothetical protein